MCAYGACLGMIGVAAISIYTEIITHLVFAFMLFISGIVIMFVSTLLDISMRLPLTRTLKLARYTLTAVAILTGITLGFTFVPYPFIGSMCEIIASASMTLYIATFSYKLESVDAPYVKDWDHVEQMIAESLSPWNVGVGAPVGTNGNNTFDRSDSFNSSRRRLV